jgi:predicted phage terminase large subunit-like protein
MDQHHILSPAAQRRLADERLKADFVSFVRRAFETVVPGESLHLNWHIHAIAHQLERVRKGACRRLIINVPPRSLKSILASVCFPAFVLGHDPSRKIVCASYSNELAVKHTNDFRAILRSDWYRRAFPNTAVALEKNTELETVTTARGGRITTSVGGSLTGRGGNIVILDDPMKPEEALSETSRRRVIQWFETTLLSRLNLKAEDAIIVVMQRLHVEDLVGVLLEKGGWECLDLPAIADAPQRVPLGNGDYHCRRVDEVLDPVREPRHVLDELKQAMGTVAFSAQYLQRPIPAEGNLIKREWLSYYDTLPARRLGSRIILSWDTAMKATELSDYSVGTVWLCDGRHCYLLDLFRERVDFPDLRRAVLAQHQRWRAAAILIEDKGSGTSLIQDLRAHRLPIIRIDAEQDKVTRLYTVQPQFESRSVLLPRHASWLEDYVAELLAFPNGRHDDQVDATSQALNWIVRRPRVPVGYSTRYATLR